MRPTGVAASVALWMVLSPGVAVAGGTAGDVERLKPFRAIVDAADEDMRRRGVDAPDAFAVELYDARIRRESEQRGGWPSPPVSPMLAKDKIFAKHLRQLASELQPSAHRLRTVAPFIVGGSPIPSAVDLIALSGKPRFGGKFCSGTLIAPRRVLTAAHCVCNNAANFAFAGQTISGTAEGIRVERAAFVDATFRCPKVSLPGSTLEETVEVETRGRDLAILELAARPAGAKSRPVLSEASFDRWQTGPYSHFVRAVGYGYSQTPTANTEPRYGRRLYADISVARARCHAGDTSFGCTPGAELVAAGHPSHGRRGSQPDTCGGDSGGPIYALIDSAGKKEFVAVGVTSRGIDQTCGSGGIYSLLSSPRATAWSQAHGAKVR